MAKHPPKSTNREVVVPEELVNSVWSDLEGLLGDGGSIILTQAGICGGQNNRRKQAAKA